MDERMEEHMISRNGVGIGVLLFALGWLLSGCATGQQGVLIEDAEGRFSYRLSSELERVPTDGSHTRLSLAAAWCTAIRTTLSSV
jgi:hypothetical protein